MEGSPVVTVLLKDQFPPLQHLVEREVHCAKPGKERLPLNYGGEVQARKDCEEGDHVIVAG